MITTSRQFADVLSGAPRVASRPRWHQSSNDFLYRNSVPCFFVMMPPPPKYSSYTIWQFILEFCRSLMESHPRFFIAFFSPMVWTYPLKFHEVWSVDCHGMWSGFRTAGPLFGRQNPWPETSAAVRIVPPCAASNNACRRQQWCWKRSPSEHHHILQHCHLERIRMKDIQKWRCLVMLCNNVLDMFR